MNRWSEPLRFLWEEEPASLGAVTPRESASHADPSGVPGPLQKAARFALVGAVAISLMSQIIEVRLIAPVDASPTYVAQCIQDNCKELAGDARAACYNECQ